MEDEEGGLCSMHGRDEKLYQSFVGKHRHRWEDNIRMELGGIMWEVFDWIHPAQEMNQLWALWTRQWIFGFYKRREIYWLAEWPLASQKGLCSMEVIFISFLSLLFPLSILHFSLSSLHFSFFFPPWTKLTDLWFSDFIYINSFICFRWRNLLLNPVGLWTCRCPLSAQFSSTFNVA